jgi:sigma-E factor negative regulatory protein RseB
MMLVRLPARRVVAAPCALTFACCWMLLMAVSATVAAQAGEPAGTQRLPRTEAQWLQAIQAAAQRVNFSGTVVYQQGGEMRTSRIVHLWDGAVSHERLQMLDGKPREFIRKDAEVQCLIPESRRVLVERSLPSETFPALGGGAPREILEQYTLKLGAVERVAGVDCQVLVLEPRDAMRYGLRLCVEPASGLLLRTQTMDQRQEAIEQMAFTDVRINERIDRALLRPSWSTEGWKVDRSDHRPTDLAKHGWSISAPPGFRRLREVERRMGPPEAPRSTLQAVLSDGLATLSVFIELGSGSQIANDMSHSHGSLSGYTRRVGDAMITVVGEVPSATAKAVAMGVTQNAGQNSGQSSPRNSPHNSANPAAVPLPEPKPKPAR